MSKDKKDKADNAIVGLDISADSLKLVKGIQAGGAVQILDFACRRFAASEAKTDLVAGQLQELLSSREQTKRTKGLTVHSTISGRKLCVRVIRLPIMPQSELYQAMRSKIRKFVSSDIEQVIFNFSVLGEVQEKDVRKLEIVFAAIQKPFFEQYLEFFKLTNIAPRVVTSACFSGWNLIRQFGLAQGATSLILINIAGHETDLTVYKENRFVLTRNISIGSRDFIDKLKGQSRFSLKRPQDAKVLWGQEQEGLTLEAQEQAQLVKLRKRLQEEADMLCKEIGLTVDHYYQISHGARINKCIILGEGVQVSGLVDFLKEKLEMPTEPLRIPEEKLQLSTERAEEFKRDLNLYTQALGALVTPVEDINLAAQAPKQLRKGAQVIRSLALPKMALKSLVGLFSLALAVFLVLQGLNFYFGRQIRAYQAKLDKLQPRSLQLMQLKRSMDLLQLQKQLYLRLVQQYPSYPLLIAEICAAIPSDFMVLDEMRFSGERRKTASQEAPLPVKFTINGRVLGKGAASSEVTNFTLALEQSGYFENISVMVRDQALVAAEVKEMGFVIDGNIRTSRE